MIDPRILDAFGTSNDRLKEIFTAEPFAPEADPTEEQEKKRAKDILTRKKFEDLIGQRQMEHIGFCLANHPKFSAVDLAWDSDPINEATYPLMLYAQGRLDVGKCSEALNKLACAEQFVTKDDKGNIVGVQFPKFTDVSVNLVKSMITRRLAAQSNKYNSLWPYYKYEPRGTSQVAKLRADVMSQLGDIMADQYDHRHHDVQVSRDMFKYASSIDFVRCAWERETQWEMEDLAEEFQTEETPPKVKSVITKEGVCFVNPHPSRVFWDNAHPLCSLNCDIGCEYVGYWDVVRYRDVALNTDYWNRSRISYSSNIAGLFSTYAQYFSQYYCTIIPPGRAATVTDASGANDIKNTVGLYSGNEMDSAMILSNYFQKLVPKQHDIGDYPFPVWIRFVTAGDNTVIFAEILPSTPCVVASYNVDDNRRLNTSMAHELMQYQDHLTNLLSYLLACMRNDNVKVLILDEDSASPEQIKAFESQAKGKNYHSETLVLKVSRLKMANLGINPEKIIQLIETRSAAGIDIIFRAMLQLLQMVERLMALSPQEQGQPAPREISATETNLIAGTTESVYSFISDSIDEMRAAKKRIIYESYIAHGNQEFKVPVISRYSNKVISQAGFEMVADESEFPNDPTATQRHTVIGSKTDLIHDYIFTSRDGAERSVNTQAANVLVQLMAILQNPIIAQAAGKEKIFEVVNEIFRLSGASVDLNLEVKEGDGDQLVQDQNQVQQQVQQVLAQITQQLEQQQKQIQTLSQQAQQSGQQLEKQIQALDHQQSVQLSNSIQKDELAIARLQDQIKAIRMELQISTKKISLVASSVSSPPSTNILITPEPRLVAGMS